MLARFAVIAQCCAVALLGAIATADEASQRQSARAVIVECIAAVDDETSGIEALAVPCPGLQAALELLGYAEQLPAGWDDDLDIYVLEDVLALHDRFAAEPTARAPDPARLRSVLEEFKQAQGVPEPSVWERIKAWLREWLGGQDREESNWLSKLLERFTLPALAMQIILYLSLALVVALAVSIIVVELRAAGLFAKRGIASRASLLGDTDGAFDKPLALADIEASPLLERPALMLRLLVSMLVDTRQLTTDRGLTHRELVRRTKFPQASDRVRFECLTHLAETIRFGRAVSSEDTLRQAAVPALEEARVLYDELRGRVSAAGNRP